MFMQPDSQTPATAPDYDFILNHGAKKSKRSILPGSGSSKKQRIVMAIGGGLALLVIVLFGASLLFGGKKPQGLLEIAQTQQELIRVSALGSKADSFAARDLSVTTQLTLTSDQADVVAYMKDHGQKTNVKLLNLKMNSQTDAVLTQAAESNRFDEVFTQTIQQELVAYQQQLKSAYDATSNPKLQQLLGAEFIEAGTLITSAQDK